MIQQVSSSNAPFFTSSIIFCRHSSLNSTSQAGISLKTKNLPKDDRAIRASLKMAQSKNEPRLLRPIHQLFHSPVNKILVKEEEGEEEVREAEECRFKFQCSDVQTPFINSDSTLNYYYGPLYIVKQFAKMTYSNSTQQLTSNCAKRRIL